MNTENNKLYRLSTLAALLSLLQVSEDELNNALRKGYNCYNIKGKEKPRLIEAPNNQLKELQQTINGYLQTLPCPKYVMYAWKGKTALLNAMTHLGQFAYVTMDVSHYYPNSKTIFVRKFFEDVLKVHGEVLEVLIKLTTLNGHLPTGAPTSPILAFLSHQELFDEIFEHTQKKDITYTLLADDITLSAKHGISREEVRYVASVLGRHGLRLKKKKTKFYSYKLALITGFFLHQSGKISVPRHIGNTIIKLLKEKPIAEMCQFELERLNGYINYQRMIDKKSFFITHIKVIKMLKQLAKLRRKQQKGI